ncbi:hypothetical protein E2C01_066113 [Portunus trituberculatus]|uniref:Uncharacterized protein n=1 Tax=Portunus trituberculatus TaxID=210409 RepID=A0A5B7HNX0_PORTR|nr:hypothetical protein [Portunus trituberculatus]
MTLGIWNDSLTQDTKRYFYQVFTHCETNRDQGVDKEERRARSVKGEFNEVEELNLGEGLRRLREKMKKDEGATQRWKTPEDRRNHRN